MGERERKEREVGERGEKEGEGVEVGKYILWVWET